MDNLQNYNNLFDPNGSRDRQTHTLKEQFGLLTISSATVELGREDEFRSLIKILLDKLCNQIICFIKN